MARKNNGRWALPMCPDKTNSAGFAPRILFAWTVFEKNSPHINTDEALAFLRWMGWTELPALRRVHEALKASDNLPDAGSALVLAPRAKAGEFTIKGITGFGLKGVSWQAAADAWALLKEHKAITIPRKGGDWQHAAAPYAWLRWHDVADCASHADRIDYWILPGAESAGPSYLTQAELHFKFLFKEPLKQGVRRAPNRLCDLPTPEWAPIFGQDAE